jgi:hypothetical protein
MDGLDHPRGQHGLSSGRRFLAVELNGSDAGLGAHPADMRGRRVGEQADRFDEGGQDVDDAPRLFDRHETWRLLDKVQPDRVRARLDGGEGRLGGAHAADFDARPVHLGSLLFKPLAA